MNVDDLLRMVEERMKKDASIRADTIAGVKTLIKRYMRTHPTPEIGDPVNIVDKEGEVIHHLKATKTNPPTGLRGKGEIILESDDNSDPKLFILSIYSPNPFYPSKEF